MADEQRPPRRGSSSWTRGMGRITRLGDSPPWSSPAAGIPDRTPAEAVAPDEPAALRPTNAASSVEAARALALVGAAVLALSLFLPWFRPRLAVQAAAGPESFTAWEAFRVADVLIAAIAIAVVALAASRPRSPDGWADLACALLGWLAAAIVLYSVHRPNLALRSAFPPLLSIGAFAALVAAGTITIGALWAGLRPRARTARAQTEADEPADRAPHAA